MDALTPAQPESPSAPPVKTMRFTLSPASLAALSTNTPLSAQALPAGRAIKLQDQFFDTPGFSLLRQGIVLKLRKLKRGALFSLQHEGTEIEIPVPEMQPDLAALGPDWQAAIAAIIQDERLVTRATTAIKQTIRHNGQALLSLESGHIITEGQKLPVCELSISAPETALPEAILAIAGQCSLRIQPETLAPRALRLAGGPAPCAQKAAPGLSGAPCLDDAIHSVISACLAQFRANLPVFFEGDEISAVHQMRVAMRRLRSALGLFNRALPTPGFLALREEAKRIANTMGDARNWDVFTDMLKAGPNAAFPDEIGFAALEAQCAAHRQAGYVQVKTLLEDPATTRFLLEAELFIAKRGWRGGLPAEILPRLAEPAHIFGTECLERLYRKLRKHGRHLAALPAHDRHLVRIELKKLRYAAEFFGGLYESRGKVKAFNRAAAGLQEELGKLNDMATAESLAVKLQGGLPDAQRALGIVLGWTAHAALGEPRALNAAWEEFKSAKLFT